MINVPVHSLLLKTTKGVDTYTCAIQANTNRKDLTTRLSASSFRPVSLRYDTINGHTPTMFATTSTSSGIDRSWVMMALRKAGREAIQSRVSAPFRRFTINSVSENWSRLPKTTKAVRWRQRFISCRSNVGYSTNFDWYPLPRYFTNASASTWGPPWINTTAASGPAASRIFHKIVASKVVLLLKRFSTATQTRRNVDLSHVRTMIQTSALRSSNSMLNLPWLLTQPKTRARMRGNMPFKMID